MVFKVNPDILVTWPVVTITDLQKSSVAFSFQSIESMEKGKFADRGIWKYVSLVLVLYYLNLLYHDSIIII